MSEYNLGNVEFVDRGQPRRKVGASLYILLAGALALMFLGVFVVRRSFAPTIRQLKEPVLAEMIPDGATPLNESLHRVNWFTPDDGYAAQHDGYLFAYTQADRAFLVLLEWITSSSRYKVVATTPVVAGETIGSIVTQIAKERVSTQIPELFLVVTKVTQPERSSDDVVFVAMVDGGGLRLLRMINKEGVTRTAMFVRGDVGTEFRMEDLDGDGTKEAIQNTTVYRLKNNVFVYDQDLSIIMTTRDTLFPKP